MASAVLVFSNSSPQDWALAGAADHKSAIDEDPTAPDTSSYVSAKINGKEDWYSLALPSDLLRMDKLVVQCYGYLTTAFPSNGMYFLYIEKNGVAWKTLVPTWTPPLTSGYELNTWNLTGLNIQPGDVITFYLQCVGGPTRVAALRFTGSYLIEKEIVGKSCTEKSVSSSLCAEKEVKSTP